MTHNNNKAGRRGKPMSNKGQTIQEPFLNLLRRQRVPVFIYLVNGIKLQGSIHSFDQFVVMLKNPKTGVSQVVYKHAISTIEPTRRMELGRPPGEEGPDA